MAGHVNPSTNYNSLGITGSYWNIYLAVNVYFPAVILLSCDCLGDAAELSQGWYLLIQQWFSYTFYSKTTCAPCVCKCILILCQVAYVKLLFWNQIWVCSKGGLLEGKIMKNFPLMMRKSSQLACSKGKECSCRRGNSDSDAFYAFYFDREIRYRQKLVSAFGSTIISFRVGYFQRGQQSKNSTVSSRGKVF